MLATPGERGVIGRGQLETQHPEARRQEAFSLPQGQVEDEPERQRGFDSEIGILPLPATLADAHGLPSGDRIRGQPHGDIAALDQRSVVCRPIPDVVFCLVIWVHSRLHVAIRHLRSPRWPGGRSWLTEGAGSVHQRRERIPHGCDHGVWVTPDGRQINEYVMRVFRCGSQREAEATVAPPPPRPARSTRCTIRGRMPWAAPGTPRTAAVAGTDSNDRVRFACTFKKPVTTPMSNTVRSRGVGYRATAGQPSAVHRLRKRSTRPGGPCALTRCRVARGGGTGPCARRRG